MSAQIQKGLPFEAYLEDPAEHATALKAMLVSPLHYRHVRDVGRPDADHLRIGRAVHAACFEPDHFARSFAVWTKQQSDGKSAPRRGAEWEAFKAEHAGQTILTRAQYEGAEAIASAVLSYPRAAALLRQPGSEAELSLRWTHAGTGLPCKMRLDFLAGDGTLVELKTGRDVAPQPFGAASARLRYPLQCAFYADGVAAVLKPVTAVKIIAVSNVEPYDVVMYSVPDEVLEIGRSEYQKALDLVVACRASGVWPGLARNEELELKLPFWALPDDGWEVGVAASERVMFGEAS